MSEDMRTVKEWQSDNGSYLSIGVYKGRKICISAAATALSGSSSIYIEDVRGCNALPWKHRGQRPGEIVDVSLEYNGLNISLYTPGPHVIARVPLHSLWPVLEREFPAALNEALEIISTSASPAVEEPAA